MERIERALEVARLHRHRLADPAAAPASAAPSFAEALAEDRALLRLEDAPAAKLADRAVLRERYLVFPDEPGPATLAYKMLRTQVLQRARAHSMRCIGVVSAASGEGKTVTAINLGMSLAAEPNQSVVLVDLDLRRPSVAATLGIDADGGLESHLAGARTLESSWRHCAGIDRLGVIPARPAPGSSELLASAATAALFKTLRAVSGEPLIVVDLPPVLLSDDVLAVAPQLDGIVLVVTEERTRREDIQRVFELLHSTPVIGTVLNASAEAESRAY